MTVNNHVNNDVITLSTSGKANKYAPNSEKLKSENLLLGSENLSKY